MVALYLLDVCTSERELLQTIKLVWLPSKTNLKESPQTENDYDVDDRLHALRNLFEYQLHDYQHIVMYAIMELIERCERQELLHSHLPYCIKLLSFCEPTAYIGGLALRLWEKIVAKYVTLVVEYKKQPNASSPTQHPSSTTDSIIALSKDESLKILDNA
eukprot:TRINITY_DN14999_c0_g1_i1.p1 TRINITY_DN14999_c0_g1~~TRINITY_DN14999_c0_g1_i1.p1  ORF type:complete len:160 (-),score=21.60 TRINITY_DN14999_c0_g1_i1:15-494(-)